MKQRSPNLGDSDVERYAKLLDGWSGKLTWPLYIELINTRYGLLYERQTLARYAKIQSAFQDRKRALADGEPSDRPKKKLTPEIQVITDRLNTFIAENERLKRENSALLEQFVRWAYNASTQGLDSNFLNRDLPGIDREQSVAHLARIAGGKRLAKPRKRP